MRFFNMLAGEVFRLQAFALDLLETQTDTRLVSAELLDVGEDFDVRTQSLQTCRGELLRGEVLEEGGSRDARVLLGVSDSGYRMTRQSEPSGKGYDG